MYLKKPIKTSAYRMIHQAIERSASDIHFCPFEDAVHIYFRINGVRTFQTSISMDEYQSLISRLKFTSGMDIGESRKPQDGKLSVQKDSHLYDLRLSTLPTQHSESLAIRILPRHMVPNFDHLFLFPYQAQKLKKWINRKAGLALLTGPTGCGKTTTLYALIQHLMKEKKFQTITLEDPVEKQITDVLQVQVNEKAGVTYHTGLKAALRHDPDILMVGEIRDRETARFAVHASYTGHLVFSTIHARDACSTIFRLIEMGISETDLKQILIGIASQELLPIIPPFLSGNMNQRAAILEILDGNLLERLLHDLPFNKHAPFPTFQQLRRKAYALGYINQNTLLSYNQEVI